MKTAALLAVLLIGWATTGVCGEVTVTYFGHSCFSVHAEDGPVIMIDPYGSYVPYPGLPAAADIVLMTHPHIDHCPPCYGEFGRVLGDPMIASAWDLSTGEIKTGNWKITDEFSVRIIEASHVNARGGGEGRVGIFRFEIDGIVFAHVGDLGKILEGPQMAALSDVEVLFVPVGKAFTLDAAEAMTVIAQLPDVRVVFPMHYRVEGITPWTSIALLDEFTRAAEVIYPVVVVEEDHAALDAEALPEATEVWILDYVE